MSTELNFTETIEKGQLVFVGAPRQYRNDCKAGAFKIGAGQFVGKLLKMEVMAARQFSDELFGYPFQPWLQVIFADEGGFVSSILFKTESMDNFLEVYRQSLSNGQSLVTQRLTARMAERASENGKYYAVEFEIEGEGQFTADIQQFLTDRPAGLFALNRGDNGRAANGSEGDDQAQDEMS